MKRNQLRAGVLLSYGQTALNALITLVYTPIVLRLLGQSQYGVYNLAGSTVAYLNLLNLGLSGSYVRFYTRYQSQNDEEGLARLNGLFQLVYTILGLAALGGGLCLSWLLPAVVGSQYTAQELQTARWVLVIMSGGLCLTFLTSLFSAYISANEQFVFQRLVLLANTLVSPLVTIPILLLGGGSVGMAAASTAVAALADASLVVFCLGKLRMSFAWPGKNGHLLREIVSFSGFVAFNSLVDQINWQTDKVILSAIQGAGATAVYCVGSQLNTMYMLIATAVSTVFIPRVHRMSHQPDKARRYTELTVAIGRIQLLILGLVATGLILFGRPFIRLWAGDGYDQAYGIALMLVLPATIPFVQTICLEIQRAENRHRFRSVVYGVMAVVNVAISIPLGRRFGGLGCAMGTAISLLLANGLVMNLFYSRQMGLDMGAFWREMGKICPALALALCLGYGGLRLWPVEGVYSLGLGIVGYTVLYGLVCWCVGMNRQEKTLVRQMAGRILHFPRFAV